MRTFKIVKMKILKILRCFDRYALIASLLAVRRSLDSGPRLSSCANNSYLISY